MKLIAIILALALACTAKAKPPAYTFDPYSLTHSAYDAADCKRIGDVMKCKKAYLEFHRILIGKSVDQAIAAGNVNHPAVPKAAGGVSVTFDPRKCVHINQAVRLKSKFEPEQPDEWLCKNVTFAWN